MSANRRNRDPDLVELRPCNHRGDFTLGDLQVDDGAVSNIGAATRQAVLKIAVTFQVRAPRLPPEALCDRSALDLDRLDGLPLLFELCNLLLRSASLLGYWHIRLPSKVAHFSPLLHCRAQVESHKFKQFLVFHFGQHHLGTATEEVSGQLLLRLDHLIDLVFDRAAANEFVHQHILGLSNSERAIGSLMFHSRIPPPVKMNDMGRRSKIEASTPRLEREHKKRDVLVLLKPAHQVPALFDFRLPVQDEAGASEHGAQERRQRRCRLFELSKDQRLVLAGSDNLRNLAETGKLATVFFRP